MFETPSSADASTSATSALDEAQKEPSTERQEYFAKLKDFISSTLSSGLKVLILCMLSLFVIYFCKVAQSNVLPTDVNCYPYTSEKGHEPEKIETHIFTNLFFRKPRKAMVLEFPDSNNSLVDGILKYFKEYKDNPKSSALGNYFVSIFESLFSKNFNYYNTIFSFVNQLPEFLLVIFGPYLGFFILIIGILTNVIFFCYYWISNLGWLWKKNINIVVEEGIVKYKDGPPQWENVRWSELEDPDDKSKTIEGSSEWTSYLMALIMACLFVWVLFMMFAAQLLTIFGAVFTIFCIISLLMYKVKLAGKKSSITELFMYFFKYNKLIIMSIFSFYVISNAYTYLGHSSAVFAVLTLFCIYYFKVIEMFVPMKTDLDERVEVEINSSQAYRVPCDPPPEKDIISDNTGNNKEKTATISASSKTEITATPPPGSQVGPPSGPPKPPTGPPSKIGGPPSGPPSGPPTGPPKPPGSPTGPPKPPTGPPGPPPKPPTGPPPKIGGPPPKLPVGQSAGKKLKPIEIDSNNIVRELKKFHKKYADFLI
jgi:hypothetical protein